MSLRPMSFALVMGLAVITAGCGSSKLGANRNAPDEFAIVTKAPLTVPPDFALRPPKPGEARPEALSTSDRTRELLIGDASSNPPSNGELALLQTLGAQDIDKNIRAILAAENGGRMDKDDSLTNQLIFWNFNGNEIDDSEAPLRVEDTEAWLAQRSEQVEAVTGGKDVVIAKDKRTLSLPGVK